MLDFKGKEITESDAKKISEYIVKNTGTLITIDCSGMQEKKQSLNRLIQILQTHKRRINLNLDNVGFKDEDIPDLVNIFNYCTSISLLTNEFSPVGLGNIARSLVKHFYITEIKLPTTTSLNATINFIPMILRRNLSIQKLIYTKQPIVDLTGIPFSFLPESIFNSLNAASHIRELIFSNCSINDNALKKITDCILSNKNIASLNLNNNLLTPESLQYFKTMIEQHVGLTKISIINNKITSVASLGNTIASNFQLTQFTYRLPSNIPGHVPQPDVFTGYLNRNTQLLKPNITGICLVGKEDILTIEGIKYIFHKIEESKTTYSLTLDNWKISQDVLKVMADLLKSNNLLEYLSITNCNLCDNDILILSQALKDHPSITALTLSKNKISDSGAKSLSNLLIGAKGLTSLILTENSIGHTGVVHLAQGIQASKSIIKLNLDSNPIPGTALCTLADKLNLNQSLIYLSLRRTNIEEVYVDQFVKLLDPSQDKDQKGKNSQKLHNSFITLLDISNPEDEIYSKNVEKLLKDYTEKNIKNTSKLISAVEQGKDKEIENLLLHASINTTTPEGTLLHSAVTHNKQAVVKLLLTIGINRKIRNKAGKTALMLATQENPNQNIIDLLEETVSPAKPIPSIQTPDKTKKQKREDELLASPQNSSKKLKEASGSSQFISNNNNDKSGKEEEIDYSLTEMGTANAIAPFDPKSHFDFMDDEEQSDETPQEKFSHKLAKGNLYQVKKMLKNNSHFMLYCTLEQDNLLHIAATNGQMACLEFLLERGQINIDETNAKELTPLYAVINDVLYSNAEEKVKRNKLKIALFLIKKGASVNKSYPLLHTVVREGHYRLMKIVLASPHCNPNIKDENHWTALTWAAYQRDIQLVDRLLIDRRLTRETIKDALEKAEQFAAASRANSDECNEVISQIVNMLRKKTDFDQSDSTSGIQWIQHFTVIYGGSFGKPKKQLVINSEKEHAQLALKTSLSTHRLFNPEENTKKNKECPGNPTTASLTFIVSTQPHIRNGSHTRQKIRIPLSFDKEYHITSANNESDEQIPEEEYKRIIDRLKAAPSDIFKENFRNNSHFAKNEEDIKKLKEDKSNFEFFQLFHHGEQALLDYLEQETSVNLIISKLREHAKFVRGCKIYGIILDIHSPRYVCENCEAGILGELNPEQSPFLRLFCQKISAIGCVLPQFSPVHMLVQVSSYMAFNSKVIADKEHKNLAIDMRSCDNNLILSKDLSVFESNFTQFQSSKI